MGQVHPPKSSAWWRGRRAVRACHLARLHTDASLPALHALLMLAQGGGNGALGGNVLSKPCSCNITLLSLPMTCFFRSGKSYAALVPSRLLNPFSQHSGPWTGQGLSGSNVRSPGPEAVPPPAILAQPPALGEDTGRPAAAAACSARLPVRPGALRLLLLDVQHGPLPCMATHDGSARLPARPHGCI